MKRITVYDLADMAKRRTISPIFERVWNCRYDRNPVVDAVLAGEAVLEEFKGTAERKIHTADLVGSLIGMALMIPVVFYGRSDFWIAAPGAVVGVFCAFCFVVNVVLLRSNKHFDSTEHRFVDTGNAETFCKVLTELVSWADYDSAFLEFNEERLKCEAKTIMVAAAVEQIKLQCQFGGCTNEEKNQLQVKLGQHGILLSHKYDTFEFFGLVPKGGYKKYFALARKKMKEEMGKVPT